MAAYDNVAAVASNFWGRPVLQADNGELYCPGFTGNTYAANPRDFVLIGSYMTPGLAEVKCDKRRDVDKKKIKGADGARLTLAGLQPADVEIRITIWTPEQLRQLEILRAIIFPGPQKVTSTVSSGTSTTRTTLSAQGNTVTENRDGTFSTQRGYTTTTIPTANATRTVTKSVTVTQPYNCIHPELALHGVRSLVFINTEGSTPGETRGSRVYLFKAMEFSLPRKGVNATMTPTSSVPAHGSTLDPASFPTPGQNPANLGPP